MSISSLLIWTLLFVATVIGSFALALALMILLPKIFAGFYTLSLTGAAVGLTVGYTASRWRR